MNKNTVELLKTDEVARELGKARTFVTNQIRQGKITGVKSGKEYLITRQELNKYLGIETDDRTLKKDLYIKELEGKVENYELRINTLKRLLVTLENVVE